MKRSHLIDLTLRRRCVLLWDLAGLHLHHLVAGWSPSSPGPLAVVEYLVGAARMARSGRRSWSPEAAASSATSSVVLGACRSVCSPRASIVLPTPSASLAPRACRPCPASAGCRSRCSGLARLKPPCSSSSSWARSGRSSSPPITACAMSRRSTPAPRGPWVRSGCTPG